MQKNNVLICLFFVCLCFGACTKTTLPKNINVDLVIENVRLFDGKDVIEQTNIVVNKGKILAIRQDSMSRYITQKRINGLGKTIIPPLANAHVHVWFPDHLKEGITAGVFTMLDMHTASRTPRLLRQFKDSLHYSTYYSSGPGATVPNGHGTIFYGIPVPVIDSTTSARQFVRDRIDEGVDYVKVLREPLRKTLDFQMIDTIIQVSHQYKKMVISHISRLSDAIAIANLGTDGFAHIWIDGHATKEQIDTLKKSSAFLIPTLLTNKKLLEIARNEEWGKGYMPFEDVLVELKKAYDGGVPILAGTDPPNLGINYSSDLYEELLLMEEAGMPKKEILKAATSNVQDAFHLHPEGYILTNQQASFLLIDGNPLKDLKTLNNMEGIWRKGKRLK